MCWRVGESYSLTKVCWFYVIVRPFPQNEPHFPKLLQQTTALWHTPLLSVSHRTVEQQPSAGTPTLSLTQFLSAFFLSLLYFQSSESYLPVPKELSLPAESALQSLRWHLLLPWSWHRCDIVSTGGQEQVQTQPLHLWPEGTGNAAFFVMGAFASKPSGGVAEGGLPSYSSAFAGGWCHWSPALHVIFSNFGSPFNSSL